MILGIGVDLVALPAFREQAGSPGSVFIGRTFTARELRAARARATARGLAPDDPAALAPHLAARWAAKEAAVKAWSAALAGVAPPIPEERLDWREIEVSADHWGRPALVLHGRVGAEAERGLGPGLAWHVSLTHDGEYAQAFVVLERLPAAFATTG